MPSDAAPRVSGDAEFCVALGCGPILPMPSLTVTLTSIYDARVPLWHPVKRLSREHGPMCADKQFP